jgi:hypothetical protein
MSSATVVTNLSYFTRKCWSALSCADEAIGQAESWIIQARSELGSAEPTDLDELVVQLCQISEKLDKLLRLVPEVTNCDRDNRALGTTTLPTSLSLLR